MDDFRLDGHCAGDAARARSPVGRHLWLPVTWQQGREVLFGWAGDHKLVGGEQRCRGGWWWRDVIRLGLWLWKCCVGF